MADKYPSPSSMGKDKPMTADDYQNRRSWLIDTAETPEDKANLKKDLAALDAQWAAQQKAKGTQAGHAVTTSKNFTKPTK